MALLAIGSPGNAGAQGPKTVKGAQSDPNYVSRLLARSECLPGAQLRTDIKTSISVTGLHRNYFKILAATASPSATAMLSSVAMTSLHRAMMRQIS